ncbi:MAG: DegT/DnrJ/EryC1/StrS aminotransferase family protein [Burkholderiaceae bacterium]|nr:DegT/DnrJ/EryC1/StrS aminotransferase family protein [Burkholderiaceae bacterium]
MTIRSTTLEFDEGTASNLPLPRHPVLGWSSFNVVDAPDISSLENLTHTAITTSGRAAIYQALLQLQLPPTCNVLVPSYHCPTMIAPVLLANLTPVYFGLRSDGLPNLDTIDAATASTCKAMLVSHYFGLARSLAEVRQWCDDRGIALIEDCAHCYFGQAGERPVGAWGDYSTASLSKFLPMPEGGMLASASRPILDLQLASPSIKAQFKGWVDVLEVATKYKRFPGINGALNLFMWLKRASLQLGKRPPGPAEPGAVAMMQDCDMARRAQSPLWTTVTLKAMLPRGRVIIRRQQNFASYARHFGDIQGAKPLFPLNTASSDQIAPYVFPLWVDDADRVYHSLRALDLPVFRWDRLWPGTPRLDGDVGPLWSQHVLQLLCHQDLSDADIERTARSVLGLLSSQPAQTA